MVLSQLWEVNLFVKGEGTRNVQVRIDPPFGIVAADAEVKAIRLLSEQFPGSDVRATSSHFVKRLQVSPVRFMCAVHGSRIGEDNGCEECAAVNESIRHDERMGRHTP